MRGALAVLACLLISSLGLEPEPAKKLGSEMVEIDGRMYWFEMQSYADWATAQRYCEDYHNMTLISLQTPEKSLTIKNFLLANPDFDMNLWSSGAKLADGQLLWHSTGEEIVHQDWARGEPNMPADSEFCIVFSANPSGWDDIECTDRWFASVCEYPE